jgi:hypothetical protein
MNIQRKMYEANKALSYFVTHNWDFKNENFGKLNDCLHAEDMKGFYFKQLAYNDRIFFVSENRFAFPPHSSRLLLLDAKCFPRVPSLFAEGKGRFIGLLQKAIEIL